MGNEALIRNNQNGRRRGRGGGPRPQQPGAPRPEANYGNRNNDARQRGNASQLLEKYKAMARDAQQAGDRVAAEYFMQYADHYYRVLNEFRARDQEQRPQQQARRDFDDGYGDEQGEGMDGNVQGYGRDDEGEPARQDSRQDGRQRDDYDRQDGRQESRQDGRQDARGDARQGGRQEPREDVRDQPRREPRAEGGRNGQPRRDLRRDEFEDAPVEAVIVEEEAPVIQGLPPRIESPIALADDVAPGGEDAAPAPRRRGRPRKDSGAGTLSLSDA